MYLRALFVRVRVLCVFAGICEASVWAIGGVQCRRLPRGERGEAGPAVCHRHVVHTQPGLPGGGARPRPAPPGLPSATHRRHGRLPRHSEPFTGWRQGRWQSTTAEESPYWTMISLNWWCFYMIPGVFIDWQVWLPWFSREKGNNEFKGWDDTDTIGTLSIQK